MRVADIPQTLRVRNLLAQEPLLLAGLFNLGPGVEAEIQFHRLHEGPRQQLYAAVCASVRGKVLEVLDEGFTPAEPETIGVATTEKAAAAPAAPAAPAEALAASEGQAPQSEPAQPSTPPPPPPAPTATSTPPPPPAPPAPPADEPAHSDPAGSALDI